MHCCAAIATIAIARSDYTRSRLMLHRLTYLLTNQLT